MVDDYCFRSNISLRQRKQSNTGIRSRPLLKKLHLQGWIFSQLAIAPEVNVTRLLRNVFRQMQFVDKVSLVQKAVSLCVRRLGCMLFARDFKGGFALCELL